MEYLLPNTVEEYAACLSCFTEKSRIVSGGTDYVIQARRGRFDPDFLLYPGGVSALHEIEVTQDAVRIGAMVTMSELAQKLSTYPELMAIADAAGDVGSPQVRAKATMAGNLCNASPAGDMLPIARLYGAELEILDSSGAVSLMPGEQLIVGPQKNALGVGQAVAAIRLNRAELIGYISAFKKIGSRERVSIARVGLAGMVRLNADGVIEDARLALGAVANTPIRVPAAEAFLRGRMLSEETAAAVTPLIAQTVHDNCRPTNRLYKTEAARGLTADFFGRLMQRR